ncbi:uncharacterized protein [Prorops nasuta]|uniref:uncharacterized protein n=1 Tax=Prorops nasuta TaxID=863751 RepID=UPI0034CF6CC6
MTEGRLSLGINVSILVILTIFSALLSLPLRLLLDTHYTRNDTDDIRNGSSTERVNIKPQIQPIDFRKLRRCPKLRYEESLASIFFSYYDRNCTYVTSVSVKLDPLPMENNEVLVTKIVGASLERPRVASFKRKENIDENRKGNQIKSLPVAGQILVTMLLVSALAAFIEVLRIRFAKDKETARGDTVIPRRTSTVPLPVQRRILPREVMLSQRSFELQGVQRSALRLLGARPSPLVRCSSLPLEFSEQLILSSQNCYSHSRLFCVVYLRQMHNDFNHFIISRISGLLYWKNGCLYFAGSQIFNLSGENPKRNCTL